VGGTPFSPFIEYREKGVIRWCAAQTRAADLQDLQLADGRALQAIAEQARAWNTSGNVGVVAGRYLAATD
jgi:hypothetical protein